MFPNLGLEPTPELHVEHMVEIMREVRRVLRDDGVVWLNYGDCFAGSGGENANTGLGSGDRSGLYRNNPRRTKIAQGNLMMMPHKVAIALQADGWIVRNDVVWWKRNPMPESVAGWRWERKKIQTGREPADWEALPKGWDVGEGSHDEIGKGNYRNDDGRERTVATYEYGDDYVLRKGSWRHTRAHEYIFQLTKQMQYYSNQEAVREAQSKNTHDMGTKLSPPKQAADYQHKDWYKYVRHSFIGGRNPRSVLDVPTAPYSGAHYATFPPNLIAPLIRASCPKRCCPECGAPWASVVEKTSITPKDYEGKWLDTDENSSGRRMLANVRARREAGEAHDNPFPSPQVIDYRPTCECFADIPSEQLNWNIQMGLDEYAPVPGIVLDPFIGSGTTGAVARELGRRWVGLDISMEYLDQQAKIRALNWTPSNALDDLPMFAKEAL